MKRLYIVFALAVLSGCGGKPSQEELLERINEKEAILQNDSIAVPQHALDAAQAFLDYINAFPEDSSRNPRFWFKAAQLYNVAGDPTQALALSDSLFKHYSGHESIPAVHHFRGSVYELALSDPGKARIEYERIINDYNTPENFAIVSAALAALEHLGKSGDEIFEELKAQGLIEG